MGSALLSTPIIAPTNLDRHQILRNFCHESVRKGLMDTDYPADMGEVDPIGMIEGTPGLDDVERRAILGRNAARLLNLETSPNSR